MSSAVKITFPSLMAIINDSHKRTVWKGYEHGFYDVSDYFCRLFPKDEPIIFSNNF